MKEYIVFLIVFYFCLKNILLILRRYKKNHKKRKYKINYKKIKSFNLGSSHSYWTFLALDEEINLNLAHSSQTFYYDKIMLNKFINKIKKEKEFTCFITISYFSFSSKELWQTQDIIQYYYPLSIKEFKGKEKIEYILYNYFPIIWNFKRKIKEKLNKKIKKELTIENRIKGHVKKLEKTEYREYNLNLLEEIIKKCQDNSIKVVLLTTPFQKEYNDYFSEELLEKNFYNVIEGITAKYKIKYLDYSHDYINFDKKEYFKKNDYDHLSLDGAKVLIRLLEKELKIKLLN